jgi:hypothetical protein
MVVCMQGAGTALVCVQQKSATGVGQNVPINSRPFVPKLYRRVNKIVAIGDWPTLGCPVPRQVILAVRTYKLTSFGTAGRSGAGAALAISPLE